MPAGIIIFLYTEYFDNEHGIGLVSREFRHQMNMHIIGISYLVEIMKFRNRIYRMHEIRDDGRSYTSESTISIYERKSRDPHNVHDGIPFPIASNLDTRAPAIIQIFELFATLFNG